MAASSRASATVATITTATATSNTNTPKSPVCSTSSSTVTPNSEAITGLATVMVGNDAVNEPARSDDC